MRHLFVGLPAIGCIMLSGCGGSVYHPAASALGKSIEAMTPALDSELAEYPNELRSALLDNAQQSDVARWANDPQDLLCRPVLVSVEAAAYSNKLQTAADSLIETSGASPTKFSELAAASFGKYAVSAGDGDPAALAADAHRKCQLDFNYDTAFANFAGSGGAESGIVAAFTGLTELWALVKPIVTGVLGFVDQQRRARAIIAFMRTDGPKLQSYVDGLATFSEKKAAYERAAAAKLFKESLAPALQGPLTDEQKQEVLAAAATYDALQSIDPSASYKAVGKSLDRLVKAASGKFNQEDMSAAISGFGESFNALKQVSENIAALEKAGEKHEELKAAIDKIRGKKPSKKKDEESGGEGGGGN